GRSAPRSVELSPSALRRGSSDGRSITFGTLAVGGGIVGGDRAYCATLESAIGRSSGDEAATLAREPLERLDQFRSRTLPERFLHAAAGAGDRWLAAAEADVRTRGEFPAQLRERFSDREVRRLRGRRPYGADPRLAERPGGRDAVRVLDARGRS